MAIDSPVCAPQVRSPIMGIRKVRVDGTPIEVAVLESVAASFTIECRTRSAGWEKATFSKTSRGVTCTNAAWSRGRMLEVLQKLVAGLATSEWPELLRSFGGVEALADELAAG